MTGRGRRGSPGRTDQFSSPQTTSRDMIHHARPQGRGEREREREREMSVSSFKPMMALHGVHGLWATRRSRFGWDLGSGYAEERTAAPTYCELL